MCVCVCVVTLLWGALHQHEEHNLVEGAGILSGTLSYYRKEAG